MKKVLLLCAVMVVATGVVFGQAFKITSVGGALGVHGLLGPEGATEVQSKGGFGMGFGPFLGFGAKVRASMASMPAIKWTGRVSFDIFQGSGGTPTQKITQNQIGIGLGAEYGLKAMMMGSKELLPYVGGELQFNIYPEGSLDPAQAGQKFASGMRIGLGLGGGIEYPMSDKLNIDVGLKLSIANLLLAPAAQTITAWQADPKVIFWSKPLPTTVTATTNIEEGTFMFLSLNIGVNFSLASATGGM
jgi:opacity protein-like surface antigen